MNTAQVCRSAGPRSTGYRRAGIAHRLRASRQQLALAWHLQRSPSMVLIPGTSSVAHLRENVAAAELVLPADAIAELDAVGQ